MKTHRKVSWNFLKEFHFCNFLFILAKSTVFESSQKEQQTQQMDEAGRIPVVSTDSVIPATDDNQVRIFENLTFCKV